MDTGKNDTRRIKTAREINLDHGANELNLLQLRQMKANWIEPSFN